MRILFTILFAMSLSVSTAQPFILAPNTSIPVINDTGDSLDLAWAGGINSSTFSNVDLNLDGILDLVLFEKEGDRVSTFLNTGTANNSSYEYAPQYRSKFPAKLKEWMFMYDYNMDGKYDIVSYSHIISASGMTFYRNVSDSTTGLEFELEYDLVLSKYGSNFSNLYVSPVNQPALADVDNDGDIDVLTFGIASSSVEWHVNQGMELFGRADTMIYHFNPGCWGNFGVSGLKNKALLNLSCRTSNPIYDEPQEHGKHGGSCMIAEDFDNDGDKELLNGDLLGDNLLYLLNGGDSANANIISQDTAFPSYDLPVNYKTFPAPYFIDMDNDNAKDLVVCGCTENISENFNNVWFYKNQGTTEVPVFGFRTTTFLRDRMIEVGAGANVAWFDVNKDGLMDILIGNYGYFKSPPPFDSGVSYYRNIGTATAPAFELITRDFAGLIGEPIYGITMTFGDLDNDGDKDMIIGDSDGFIHYYKDNSATGNPAQFVKTIPALNSIDVGQFAAPALHDFDKDGLLDLVIGEASGNLNYYKNVGSNLLPSFSLETNTFGGVSVVQYPFITGYSHPEVLSDGANTELLVGSQRGYIYHFNNIDGNLTGNFNMVDSTYEDVIEKGRATISRFDIDNDSRPDLLVGNYAGGITLYTYMNAIGINDTESDNSIDFGLYPNPASDQVTIQLPVDGNYRDYSVQIINITGELLFNSKMEFDNKVVNIGPWPDGIYICRLLHRNGKARTKSLS